VDVEGSDFAGGKVEMLPTEGRFIGLIVGFIQMTMGILRKLGGKKTKIEKEGGKEKEPKDMTPEERQKARTETEAALVKSKQTEKGLGDEITRLKGELEKASDEAKGPLTQKLNETAEQQAKVSARTKELEGKLQALQEPKEAKRKNASGTIVTEGTEKPAEPLDPKQVGQQLDTMLLNIFGDAPGLQSCLFVEGTQDGKVTMTLDEGPLNLRVNQKQKSAEVMKKVLQEKKGLLPMVNERSGRRATEPMDRARLKAVLDELEAALRAEKEKRMGK